jgi:hypothetical protein
MLKDPSGWTALGLLLCVVDGAIGDARRDRYLTKLRTFHLTRLATSYRRESNYAPQLIPLLAECKPDPPGSTVYQRYTTVWTYTPSGSTPSSDGANRN